jgi:hypothetical protein
MSLTPEQKKTVSEWVAAGDSLSAIQNKLRESFQVSLTYRDVRFLVDDLNLELKDAAPKVDVTDVTKATAAPAAAPAPRAAAPEKKGFFDKAKEKLGLAKDEPAVEEESLDGEIPPEELQESAPPMGGVTVSVDKVTLIPGAIASGSVTFSDGVTGKWMVDQYGRPGFTQISQDGYRPKPADAQAFMQELSMALQKQGF